MVLVIAKTKIACRLIQMKATVVVQKTSEDLLAEIVKQKGELEALHAAQETSSSRIFNKEISAFNAEVTKQKRS